MSRRDEILAALEFVPPLPAATIEISRILQDEDVEMGQVVRLIEHEPGLSVNLLRMANSPYYGSVRSIASVRDAVVRLGLKTMADLVLLSTLRDFSQARVSGYDLEPGALWDHALAAAIGVEALIERLELSRDAPAFTAALLMDVGKIALGTFVEVEATPLIRLAHEEDISFEVAEQRVLGIDHAEVGAVLLERWNLPSPIVELVKFHHRPEAYPGDHREVMDAVHIADTMAMLGACGTGAEGLHYEASAEAMARLGLQIADFESLIGTTLERVDQFQRSFGLAQRR